MKKSICIFDFRFLIFIYLTFESCLLFASSFIEEQSMKLEFFEYPRDRLEATLNKNGYASSYAWNVTRNNDGSKLIFTSRNENSALEIDCKGRVRKSHLDGEMAWFSNNMEVVAYADETGQAFFKNGYKRNLIINPSTFDYSSKYFLANNENDLSDGETAIYSSQKPDRKLEVLNVVLANSKIFVDTDIYVIGPNKSDGDSLLIYHFKENGNNISLFKVDDLKRPSGKKSTLFGIVDMNPENNEIVVRDVRDGPFGDQMYTIDISSMKVKNRKLGGFGLYTRCNFINVLGNTMQEF